MAVQYYLIVGRKNLARVVDGKTYEFLNQDTGAWEFDEYLPIIIYEDPMTLPVTLARAKTWASTAVPTLEPEWLEEVES